MMSTLFSQEGCHHSPTPQRLFSFIASQTENGLENFFGKRTHFTSFSIHKNVSSKLLHFWNGDWTENFRFGTVDVVASDMLHSVARRDGVLKQLEAMDQ